MPHYRGELGTDFGPLGAWWGGLVAKHWEHTVDAAMRTVKTEAERLTARRTGHGDT